MAWGQAVREAVFERQEGKCSICERPLSKRFVLHHRKNRCCGGKETLENGEARHPDCESWMHAHYKHGNKNDVPQQRVTKRSQKKNRGYKPLKTHRNHVAPVWHYYEHDGITIGYFCREKKHGTHTGVNSGGKLHEEGTSSPVVRQQRHRRLLHKPCRTRKTNRLRVRR